MALIRRFDNDPLDQTPPDIGYFGRTGLEVQVKPIIDLPGYTKALHVTQVAGSGCGITLFDELQHEESGEILVLQRMDPTRGNTDTTFLGPAIACNGSIIEDVSCRLGIFREPLRAQFATYNNGTYSSISAYTPSPSFDARNWHFLRVRFQFTKIQMRWWYPENDEPTNWMYETTSANPTSILPGKVGWICTTYPGNQLALFVAGPIGKAEIPPSLNHSVSGIVQINGSPVQRTVRAFGYNPTVQDLDGAAVNLSKSLGHATSDSQTGEYSIDLLGGYDKEVFVVAFDDYGIDFQPDLVLAVGDRVHPSTPNGHVWECTGNGTLPNEEPEWVIDIETEQLYGSASMIAKPFYRPMVHGPVAPEVDIPTISFSNRQILTISSANVDADLQDFQFKITEANLNTGFWDVVHPYGDDILVTDGDGNILPLEVVVIDRARQKLLMYVKVPLISSTSDTTLRIYYGSSDYMYRPSNVWGDSDVAVVHLQDPTFSNVAGGSTVNVEAVGSTWKRPNLLKAVATSGHVGVHQGIAFDGAYYYLFHTNEIKKMDLSWSLITSNTDPVGDLTATTNHLGDGDVHNGILYIPIEVWGGCGSVSGQTVAMFSAADLSYVGEYDISSQGHEVSSLVIEPDDDRVTVTSYCNDDRMYQYKLSDMSFIGELSLSAPIDKIQGITRVGDYYYITSDGTKKLVYRVRLDGTVDGIICSMAPGNADNLEGLTHNGSELLILIDMLGTTGTQEVFTYEFVDGADFVGKDPAVSEDYPFLSVELTSSPTKGTMSVWFAPVDNVQRAIVSYSANNPSVANDRCTIAIDDGINLGTWDSNGSGWLYTNVDPDVDTLQGAFVSFASGGPRYVGYNGNVLGSSASNTIPSSRNSIFIGIEDRDTNEGFSGTIQEVRFRATQLSNEWLKFEDLNVRTPGASYTAGTEEVGDFTVVSIG